MSDVPLDQPHKPFSPPSPEQVAAHLTQHTPAPVSPWAARLPMISLGVALVLMMLIRHPLGALLPWIALAGVFLSGAARLKSVRALEREVAALGEQAMLRRYRQALRRAWRVMPRLTQHPILHGRAVAAMAHCLDDLGSHESAIAAYDHLLAGMPKSGPATVHLQINRAIAALRVDRLSDADEALRRIRGNIGPYMGTPIGGAFRMAQLIQDVRTHHFADALEFEQTLADDLRPLGVDAGFGYALMAKCVRDARVAADDDPGARAERSAAWWQRATVLLEERSLCRAFPELKGMGQDGPRVVQRDA